MPTTQRYTYDSTTDLPLIQAVVLLAREVHGTLELFDGMPLRTMRRALAGDLARRDVSSHRLTTILRRTCTAALLVKDTVLARRCRDAVDAFAQRAPEEVQSARLSGAADVYYEQAQYAEGAERERLLELWRRALMRG